MKHDIVIIGAGIVGLATALKLKEVKPDLDILIIDKEKEVAAHQTGHNSGVIHSGLYYKPGSLKATNCIRGYNMLLDFCETNEIPYEKCGKIVVATSDSEVDIMNGLYERGIQNGLTGLKKIGVDEMREIEPHVAGKAAIFVPQTGIIDYTAVSKAYLKNFKKLEGKIAFNTRIQKIITKADGTLELVTSNQTIETKLVVNCSGLYSDKVAKMTGQEINVKIIPFRGEYYELKKDRSHLVKNLIYPVPDPNFPFLGVHFTRMINGGVEAGPNAVLAFKREGYTKGAISLTELSESLAWPGFQKVAFKYWKTGLGEMYRSFSKAAFTKALQKLMPELKEEDLQPGGAGVRAQACDRSGKLIDDFLILENEYAVNVCNAPSPAATSSLSIGTTVAEKVLERF